MRVGEGAVGWGREWVGVWIGVGARWGEGAVGWGRDGVGTR